MFVHKFAGVACIAALVVAGCSSPEPQVTRAVPLYSKSGEALCIEGSIYDPNSVYDRPNCDEVCMEDPVAGANVAICPPYVDPQRPRGGDDDDSTTTTGQNPTGARP